MINMLKHFNSCAHAHVYLAQVFKFFVALVFVNLEFCTFNLIYSSLF